MNAKRQINGTKYNVPEVVKNAIETVDNQTLNTEKARKSLGYLGHKNPADELVNRYARESAILDILARTTGANFSNQIGKIDFSTIETAVSGVESYLNRRIAGQHARWTK
jgi:hypothetical protein